jgi:threonine synthase
MVFTSTNLKAPPVSFGEALLKGIAPDGGLYMPSYIPVLRADEMESFPGSDYSDIAVKVLRPFLCPGIPEEQLRAMAVEAYNFSIPLEECGDNLWIMRLDQGPTASFKDFAARMMARLMQFYSIGSQKKLIILVATSGDTGSAIASAYHGLPGVEVVILYPEKEVSENQRRQMTTLGDNIRVLSIDGKFDDCQRLVKEAFADQSLAELKLSSANSINIGRLLPQAVYYFYAWSRLSASACKKLIFAVPSGNFGNLMGGLIAWRMGLPVERFVVATNRNDEFPEYLRSGIYKPLVPSKNCISNAMNVGHPSNLARIISLYGGTMDEKGNITVNPDISALRRDLFSVSVSDEVTAETISEYSRNRGVVIEPHGAVALAAVDQYRKQNRGNSHCGATVVLETAHPAKFPELVAAGTGQMPEVPSSLMNLEQRPEVLTSMGNEYKLLRKYLINNL